jgi:hypothetical protein
MDTAHEPQQILEREIRAEAASLGPGYRGNRADLSDEDRAQRARELLAIWVERQLGEPPEYLVRLSEGQLAQWVERRAKLFEIGEYEDKGLVVREEDLQRLAQNFEFPVNVLIEHVENPLRLGYLTSVEALGPELFGTLALTPEANRLLETSGAHALSLSVSRDLDRIYEVSVVGNPRVQSARLFCENFLDTASPRRASKELELEKQLREREAREFVESLVRSGHVPPSAREAAIALLFSADDEARDKVVQFMESLPPIYFAGELVPGTRGSFPAATPEEIEFYKRAFPDMAVEEILKRRSSGV